MKLVTCILTACLALVPPAWGEDAINDLSIDVSNCNEEPKTPACASWVLTLCQWRKNPDLCRKVGFADVVFIDKSALIDGNPVLPSDEIGRAMSGFPTLYKIVRGAATEGEVRQPGIVAIDIEHFDAGEEERLLGVRKVSADRFEPARRRLTTDQTFKDIVGTHEIMIGMTMPTSLFFRKQGTRWVLTSWSDDSLGCGYHDSSADIYAMCKKRISVEPWDFYISYDSVLTLRRHEWQVNDYIRYLQRAPKQWRKPKAVPWTKPPMIHNPTGGKILRHYGEQ
jgi:hypothetical protein